MFKKTLLSATALILMVPAAAFAQSTGTVTINGHVDSKCLVVGSGGATSNTFSQTKDLGALDQTNGTLKDAGTLSASFGTVGAQVVCNSASPTITVQASPLVASAAGTPTQLTNGYANTVDYTAHVSVTTVTGTAGPFNAGSNPGTPVGPSAVGAQLANTGTNNVFVTADSWVSRASSPSTALLVADTYQGTITFTISPA
ncbi:MAG: hypothetical protein KGJ57_22740 [Sphingomonadales bacterium]|nr:hypothetical protein [Sphingomonadales bacterium]MDE2172203.1 hypothetical protein [Sphingomonadales bacterium]